MGTIPVAKPVPTRRPHVARRALIALALAVAGIALVWVVGAVVWPAEREARPVRWVDVGAVNEFEVNEPVHFPEDGFWLVKLGSGEILALSEVDPHLGCTVPWRPDFEFAGRKGWFRNPCHAETYDLDGTCVFGPCVRGLDRFEVRVRGGRVQVNTEKLIPGPPVGAN